MSATFVLIMRTHIGNLISHIFLVAGVLHPLVRDVRIKGEPFQIGKFPGDGTDIKGNWIISIKISEDSNVQLRKGRTMILLQCAECITILVVKQVCMVKSRRVATL